MITKTKTYTWQEDENAVSDENGNVEITVTAADGVYVLAIPNDERSKTSTVSAVWELHGEPTT